MVFALQVTRVPNVVGGNLAAGAPSVPGSTQSASLRYLHHDHLGSVAAITDGTTGQVIERLAFDPWGKRRNVNGQADVTDALVGQTTDRGYTEHEHLDEMGLIHMNGRVYDSLVGRFMSADPTIPNPYGLQSFNRYAYVYNNPLKLFDPSGFEPFGTDSSGQRTQYSDTGNGTVSNTYTGNTYAVDSGPNGYQPSRSTYGNGISAQNVAGPSGQGAAPVATYNSSTGQWNLTNYGQQLGSKNNTYATIVSDAVDNRTYRQIGQRDFKSPAVDLLAAAWQYFVARFGFGTGPKAPAGAVKNTGDLTKAEIKQIQKTVDEAGRPLDVVGSAATGNRRGVGTNDPVGKGLGTKSDIDYVAPPSSLGYYDGLQGKLPSIDPKTGIIPGIANPNIGPSIRFEPK